MLKSDCLDVAVWISLKDRVNYDQNHDHIIKRSIPANVGIMLDKETSSLVVAVAGLALVSISSIPAFWDLIKRLRPSPRDKNTNNDINGNGRAIRNGGGEYSLLQEIYEDDDGQATRESLEGSSDRLYLIFISILSATGALLSLALGIVVTLEPSIRPSSTSPSSSWLIDQWLQLGIWVRNSSTFTIHLSLLIFFQDDSEPYC